MNHPEAVRLMAAERYLLGDLSAQERDEYEEHYFSCPDCAEDVKVGVAFLDNAKAVLHASEITSTTSSSSMKNNTGSFASLPAAWLRPAFALPAVVILLVVTGYQNFVSYPRLEGEIADAHIPRILASAPMINVGIRATNGPIAEVKTRRGEPFLLFVNLPSDD